MAKKTVRPDTPAASPTPSRRRAPANGRRTTTRRATAPGNGPVPAHATAVAADSAADMRIAGDIDSAAGRTPSPEEIAEAAYRRYLERGGEHGRDFDDWLEAERSLRSRTG